MKSFRGLDSLGFTGWDGLNGYNWGPRIHGHNPEGGKYTTIPRHFYVDVSTPATLPQREKVKSKLYLHSFPTLHGILEHRRFLGRQQGLGARGRVRGR